MRDACMGKQLHITAEMCVASYSLFSIIASAPYVVVTSQ